MKNKILSIAAIICIAVLVTFNVNLTSLENDSVDLASIVNLASANAEWGFWDGVSNTFQGQGWTKDEREVKRPCPTSTSSTEGLSIPTEAGTVTLGSSYAQTNPPGRFEISCATGKVNCSHIYC